MSEQAQLYMDTCMKLITPAFIRPFTADCMIRHITAEHNISYNIVTCHSD
jgi:hypothetical protein